MNNLPSTKNWVLILFGGDKHFLNAGEAEQVKQAIRKGDKYIDLGTCFFASNQFVKLINGTDYQEAERIKKGDYKCSGCDSWIPKGKTCGKCL